MEKTRRVAYECSPRDHEESLTVDTKKKKVMINKEQVILHLMVGRAKGVDNFKHYPFILNRHYNVVCWVEPGKEVRTAIIEGKKLVWNVKGSILLENPDDDVFLNVEIQRFNSAVDPGTSCGRVVVGRTRIPLPKNFHCDEIGSYPLVRFEGGSLKTQGHIAIAMRLEKSICLY